MITDNLKNLNTRDIYSLVLFALYKIKDIPDYRVLSELVFAMDKNSLLNLCELFGGQTLRIPTVDELGTILYALLVWEDVNNGKEFEDCLSALPVESQQRKEIRALYSDLADVLRGYEFV